VSVPVRAVLLDAFGTLLTLESPVASLREVLAEHFRADLTDAQAAAALDAEVAFYRAHMHLGRDAASLAGLHLQCGEVLRAALPQEPWLLDATPQALAAALAAALRFHVYPEVPDTLATLRAAGLKLVVVSNWDVSVAAVLAQVGLRPALDGVISSAVVGAAKPDPLPLIRGLELAGVAADQAVHVGDSVAEDVAGALAAGIQPILLQREGERGDRPRDPGLPDRVTITSLADLPACLGL